MLGRVVASSAVLITLAGCAEARSATTKGGIPSRAFSKAILVADSSPADVARVVCEKDAVRLKNPDVRAQRDGVHFLIENPGDAWGVDLHRDSWAYGTAEGFELKDGATPDTRRWVPEASPSPVSRRAIRPITTRSSNGHVRDHRSRRAVRPMGPGVWLR